MSIVVRAEAHLFQVIHLIDGDGGDDGGRLICFAQAKVGPPKR